MDVYVTQAEYKEHKVRMKDEHERTNARLKKLEEDNKSNNKLLVSIEKMAVNMENMQKEQKSQGKRLELLENRDGEKWRKTLEDIIKIIIGIVIGYISKRIGIV